MPKIKKEKNLYKICNNTLTEEGKHFRDNCIQILLK